MCEEASGADIVNRVFIPPSASTRCRMRDKGHLQGQSKCISMALPLHLRQRQGVRPQESCGSMLFSTALTNACYVMNCARTTTTGLLGFASALPPHLPRSQGVGRSGVVRIPLPVLAIIPVCALQRQQPKKVLVKLIFSAAAINNNHNLSTACERQQPALNLHNSTAWQGQQPALNLHLSTAWQGHRHAPNLGLSTATQCGPAYTLRLTGG